MNNIEKKKKPNQTNESNKMLLFLFLFSSLSFKKEI